jgi:hypothetical protein
MSHAAELAHRLARDAEAVCRHYLSNGHREGRYWLAGDVANSPGRSLYVRLKGPDGGKGAAGNAERHQSQSCGNCSERALVASPAFARHR